MTHDQETRDAAVRYIHDSIDPSDYVYRAPDDLAQQVFLAGASHGRTSERTRILELLRSSEAFEYYNSESDGVTSFNGANPEQFSYWLEEKLTKVVDK